MIEDIEPFIEDKPVVEDLFSMINAFESMEIFKNIEMLDIKCKYIVHKILSMFFLQYVK